MKVKMYQVPVTEMYAVRTQAVVCGTNPDGAAGIGFDGGGTDPEPEVPMD